MRKSSKAYLIASLVHLVMTFAWVMILPDPSRSSGTTFTDTIFLAHSGYWFYSTLFPTMLEFYERKRYNNMLLFGWSIILCLSLGFGLTGLFMFIKACIAFSDPLGIRATINIFWGYGLAQIGIREISGEPLNSIYLKKPK